MKRIAVICSLAIAVFGLLTGCNNPLNGVRETGTITITLAASNARFAYPPSTGDLAQMNAVLVVTKEGAAAVEHKFAGNEAFSIEIEPGNYTIMLSLFYKNNNNDVPLAKMEAPESVTVEANKITEKRVTVTRQFAVAGVTVSPTGFKLPPGGTHQLNATVTISQTLPQDVTWKVAGPAGVTLKPGTTISAAGELKIDAAEPMDTVLTVTATSTLMDVSGTATVTVGVSSKPVIPDGASVTVDGNNWVGQVLTATLSNLSGTGASYQWKRNNVDITGATNKTYTLVNDDVNKSISVEVSHNDFDGVIEGGYTKTIVLKQALPSNAAVTISGTPTVGQPLTANTANFPSGTLTYQWKRGSTNIGTNNNTYTLVSADSGASITVVVSHPDYSGSVTSNAVTVAGGGGTPPTGNTFNVSNAGEWTAAIAAIKSGGNGASTARNSYTINVTGNFSIDGVTDYTFGSVTYIEVTINGSGTISLNSTGNLLRIGASQTVTLKGPTLQGRNDNNGPLIYLTGVSAIFNMESGLITGNKNSGSDGGGVGIGSYSRFTMTGGKVTGNTAASGGGVAIFGGTFYLEEGEVSDNTSTGSGGGGGVYGSNGTGLYMSGGKIKGNTSTGYGTGGGVLVGNITFRMSGGEVSGNTAASGGGVYVFQASNSIFHIENGIVYGSDETGVDENGKPLANNATNTANGAALYVLTGGTAEYGSGTTWTAIPLTGSSSTSRDETIEVVNGELQGGSTPSEPFNGTVTITGKFWVGETLTAHVTDITDPVTFMWSRNGQQSVMGTTYEIQPADAGTTISVRAEGSNGIATGYISVVSGTFDDTFNVPDEDWWYDVAMAISEGGGGEGSPKRYLINVNDNFPVTDTTSVTFGNVSNIEVIFYGNGTYNTIFMDPDFPGSLLKIGENQTVIMGGVTLKGLSNPEFPQYNNNNSLVYIDSGTLIMNSGAITGNTNTSASGGGVYVNDGTFTMNGGTVSSNSAGGNGSGVHIDTGTFTMNGGEVSGNTASLYGGGVHVYGVFNMNGGAVSGNTSSAGGGVYLSGGTFRISNGVVYGDNESVTALRNTANYGGALSINGGAALHGTFNGNTWNSEGTLATTDDTIKVVNGVLQQ